MNYYLGIDLGGTSIKTGVVDESYHIIGRAQCDTNLPKSPAEIAALICKSAEIACADAGISLNQLCWAGVGVPGTTDPSQGMITFSSNFNFNHVPMGALIQKEMNMPVFLENDANCAIYGEMWGGSAKGYKNAIMLTLGTGVGGGILIDGRIYSGFNHLGAELGHVGIVFDGEECPCGNRGCIEMYCSATALNKMIKEAMALHQDSLLWDLAGQDNQPINGRIAFDGAAQGDDAAIGVVEKYTTYLGYAVTNYINIFQPEIVVLGGGVSKQGALLVEPVKKYVRRYALGYGGEKHTQIDVAALGNDAGIIGAALLGIQYHGVEEIVAF